MKNLTDQIVGQATGRSWCKTRNEVKALVDRMKKQKANGALLKGRYLNLLTAHSKNIQREMAEANLVCVE